MFAVFVVLVQTMHGVFISNDFALVFDADSFHGDEVVVTVARWRPWLGSDRGFSYGLSIVRCMRVHLNECKTIPIRLQYK